MKQNITRLSLSLSAILILSACDSSNDSNTTPTSTKASAINKIERYATDGKITPTLQDYSNAGVSGVHTNNLSNINEIIENSSPAEVDTAGEIQLLVNAQDNNPDTTPKVIIHHGITYGTVISPHTGKVWLDRNIGETKVCPEQTTYLHVECSGHYYQWGRNSDGHQTNSLTTNVKGKTITDSGDKFVINHNDWTSSINRTQNWAATDGRSVCPVGFRVPTIDELLKDTVEYREKNIKDFEVKNNFLNFPRLTGIRTGNRTSTEFTRETFHGGLWSNSVDGSSTYYLRCEGYSGYQFCDVSKKEFFNPHDARPSATKYLNNTRRLGLPVRCIKD